jgi:N-carbamoylputrescine amidase
MPKASREGKVCLGLVQLECGEDSPLNLERAIAAVEAAAANGAEVVCLPELFLHRYPCQTEDTKRFELAESIPGPTTEVLSKLAARLEITLLGSLFERRTEGLYHNTAVVLAPDGKLHGRYRKMHIPDDPLYYEKFYFTPGDRGFQVIETPEARIAPLVCWDQWFPEAARLATLKGADLLLYPTAIGWQFDLGEAENAAQHDAWETVQRGHAIANGVFVAAVNRVGFEPSDPLRPSGGEGIRFFGQSFVCDPTGRVLARAGSEAPQTLLVDCDLALIAKTRRDWPFLRDRRVDAYAKLSSLLDDD